MDFLNKIFGFLSHGAKKSASETQSVITPEIKNAMADFKIHEERFEAAEDAKE